MRYSAASASSGDGDRRFAGAESHMSDRKLPVWRSALYVPANVPRFIDGAHRRGADAIIVDLEDSVPIAERPAARRDLQATAENVARGGADVIVRINRPWRQAMLDLEAAICPRVTALAVTKVDSADHIRLVGEVVSELEAERGMAVGTHQIHRDDRDRRRLVPHARRSPRPIRASSR